jgi:hypothetical protein
MHLLRHRWPSEACFALVVVTWTAGARAAPVAFETGADLEQRLAAPVSLSWTNTPAVRALQSLSASRRIAIVLDRRIDPDQPISLVLADEPLRSALDKIAKHLHAAYCQLGPVAYLGPERTAANLRTLAAKHTESVRPLAKPRVLEFLRLRSSHWDDLAEPRQLAAALAEEAQVELLGAEQIPHDLWRAADLPPLTWIDRLTLLAAQFDLAFQIKNGGRQVRLVPAPERATITRTYPAGRRATALAKRWARALPDARLLVEKDKIRVEGRLEDHETVEQRFQGSPTRRTKVVLGEEVYQLSVENGALDEVVEQVAARLKLDVRWDLAAIDAAGISVEQLISVRVKDVALDTLLRAVLDDTKLTFDRQGQTISIRPADE